MSEVGVDIDGGLATITLAAPSRRNSLNVVMADDLCAAFQRLDDDQAIGAIVLRGSGGYFCAGADRELIAAAMDDPAAASAYESLSSIYGSFAKVSEIHVPTIAAVHGGAVGAGVNLLLACSLRVIARDATIAPGFRPLGLHPGGGHLALLNRLAGFEATVAIGVFGEAITGERAQQLGIAWAAVADEDVDDLAVELGRKAASDPELSRLIMRSLRNEVGPPPISLAAALDLERASQMRTQRRRGERSSVNNARPDGNA